MSRSSAIDGGQFGTKRVVIKYLLRSGQPVDYIWGLFREPACMYVCSLSADPRKRTHGGDAVKFWYV